MPAPWGCRSLTLIGGSAGNAEFASNLTLTVRERRRTRVVCLLNLGYLVILELVLDHKGRDAEIIRQIIDIVMAHYRSVDPSPQRRRRGKKLRRESASHLLAERLRFCQQRR